MGCGGSKVDHLPLVTLCRERKDLVKTASHDRYALAAAHLSYFQSLRDVGEAIHRFVDEELVVASSSSLSPGSPVLTLPSDGGKPAKNPKISSSSTSISHSVHDESDDHKHGGEESDGSHLHLSSGSGSVSESELDSGHIHIERSPEHEEERLPEIYQDERPPEAYMSGYGYPYPMGDWGFPVENPRMYYMKRSEPPARSVVYQEPENHRVGPGYRYAGGYYPPPPEYQNAGFFGYAPPPENPEPPPEPAPPSPPPAAASWDFLNLFDTYDYGGAGYPGYYGPSGSGLKSSSGSPDSREVREREGIPELEEETEQEVAKEAYRETMGKKKKKKKVAEHEEFFKAEMDRGYSGEGTSKSVPVRDNSEGSSSSRVVLSSLSSDESPDFASANGKEEKSTSSSGRHETTVTKSSEEELGRKKGVSFEVEEANTASMTFDVESSKLSSLTTLSFHGTRDLREAVKEIKEEFEVASSYGKEVAVLLEVSQLPYQQKSTGLKVILSRIMYLVAPSMLSSRSSRQPPVRLSPRTLKMAKVYSGQADQDFSANLSSTLEKLYVWEKKLYKEVKDEEKLRVLYEEKCERLKRLDSEGAESSKIDATRAAIRKLLTKIDVCISSVDSISSRIHKLRDEELQPQLTQLIHGLIRMWRSMLKCHQKQFQAIMESKVRSLKANTGLRRDSGLKATLDLEMELRDWSTRFNNWISTQRSYVESLNGWLARCLQYEPEDTPDGPAPFSPGRAGAPPIFVICNDWHEAMLRISANDVANAMQVFASNLHELWERQDDEQRQRVKAEYISHDFEKRLNTLRAQSEHDPDASLEKTAVSKSGVSPLDDLKVDLDSMRKKLAEERARHKEAIKLVHTAASSSLQAGLIPIFEALGSFTSDVVKAHEQVRLPRAQTS